jgi:hypothetical protein
MLNSEMSLLTGNVKMLILATVYGLSLHRDRVFEFRSGHGYLHAF